MREKSLGTWGAGAFENDIAEDLLEKLRSIGPEARSVLLKNLLEVPGGVRGELRRGADPAEILAGIAVVAINISGGPLLSGEEDFPEVRSWLSESAKPELRIASDQALCFIENEVPWYWESWIDEEGRREVLVEVRRMRELISF